ncbi:MAG: hypothetical protein QM762_08790 [Chryseolinea sp.]
MLIHAHTRRQQTTHEFGGKRYVFKPNDDGHVICDVVDDAAIDRFLELDHAFREYLPHNAQAPARAPSTKTPSRRVAAKTASAFVIYNGNTKIDLGAMNDAELRAFADGQDLDSVDAALTGDDLRKAIKAELTGTE